MHPSLPGCFAENLVAVNGALWTIKIEIAFYLLLPVLIWFLKKLKSLLQVNLTLLVLYVLSVLYTFLLQKYAEVFHFPSQLANQFPAFTSKTDFSYPLYLFHFPLIQLMAHFGFYKNCFPLAFFLTFPGVYLASVIALNVVALFKNK